MDCKVICFERERECVFLEDHKEGVSVRYRGRLLGRATEEGQGFLPEGENPHVTVNGSGQAYCDGRLVARVNGSGCCWAVRNGWEKPIAWVESPSYPLTRRQMAAVALALLVVPWI